MVGSQNVITSNPAVLGPYLSLKTDAEADDVETDSLVGIKPIEDSFDIEVERFMNFEPNSDALAKKIKKRFDSASESEA